MYALTIVVYHGVTLGFLCPLQVHAFGLLLPFLVTLHHQSIALCLVEVGFSIKL